MTSFAKVIVLFVALQLSLAFAAFIYAHKKLATKEELRLLKDHTTELVGQQSLTILILQDEMNTYLESKQQVRKRAHK